MSRAGRRPVAGNAAPDFDVSTLTSVDLFRVVARIGQGKATLPPGVSIAELQELAAEKARQEHPAQPWQANPSDDGASLGAESADPHLVYNEALGQRFVDPDFRGPRNGKTPPDLTRRRPISTCMADVVAERVRWLWFPRIPLGKLTLFDGDPDVGKSTVSIDIAARVSNGAAMPDLSASGLTAPAAVILVSAEDGAADTIRPRLDAAGADVGRVHLLTDVEYADEEGVIHVRPWSMPVDFDVLEKLVMETEARLVIIDPMNAFLVNAVDSHRDQDVRGALAPLARLAEETGPAVVLIRHLTKAGGANALYRGGGSIGIIGAARSAVLLAKDPTDPSDRRRVMARVKGNLAPEWPSLAYELVPAEEHDCSRVRWLGVSDQSAARLLQEPQGPDERDELAEMAQLLWDLAVEGGGSIGVSEAMKALRNAGYEVSTKTLQRARHRAGLEVSKPKVFGGVRSFVCPAGSSVDKVQHAPAVHTVRTGVSRDCAQEIRQSGQHAGALTGLLGCGDCGACNRHLAGSGNDRLRSGYCPACYRAWRRAAQPDRSEFEAARRKKAET